MKRTSGVLILMSLLFIQGCQLDQPIKEKVGIGIWEDIVLSMKQSLSPSGPGLNFVFQSKVSINCEGGGFEYKKRTTSDGISIQLLHLDIPDPCQGGYAQAIEQIPMPKLPGTFSFTISIGDLIQNKGVLTISDEDYRLTMNTQDGIYIPYYIMHRIPKGTLWGYIYNSHEQDKLVNDFKQLVDLYTEEPLLKEGSYGDFTVSDSLGISLPLPADRGDASPFIFNYIGVTSGLAQWINEIRLQLPEETELKVFSWNGENF